MAGRFLSVLVLLCCLGFSRPAFCKAVVSVSSSIKNNFTILYAENSNPWLPYHVELSFDVLENLKAFLPLPIRLLIPPHSKVEICRLLPLRKAHRTQYHCNFSYGFGDPSAVPDKDYPYLLPYENGCQQEITQGYFSQVTHQSCHCLDFDLDEGTPICAARGGTVITVKQDFNVGGEDKKFNAFANCIEVLHRDGTWASYAHLKFHGSLVRLGDTVQAGQVIGYSGHTGQASGPHLHFAVNRASWDGSGVATAATKFLDRFGAKISLREDYRYTSFHPQRGGQAYENTMKKQGNS